jgi:hypothetical protein
MSVDAAINLLLALLDNAARISALITAARATGRTELDPADWTVILAADDAARAALNPPPPPRI